MRTLHLHTTGRRTGASRRTPLYYVDAGEAVAIITSNGGRDRQPAWWLNLQAEPDAEIEIGRSRRLVHARAAGPEESERLWPAFVAGLPAYDTYRRRTDREIRIVILEPRDPP